MKKIVAYVVVFGPIKILLGWAHQNLIFVKAINVVVKKMARNGRSMANSYHCGLFARPVFTSKFFLQFVLYSWLTIPKDVCRNG